MKFLFSGILVVGIFSSLNAKADESASLDCFNNFEAKISSLESYSVTYVEPKGVTEVQVVTVMRENLSPVKSEDNNPVQLKLIRAKKKS